MTFTVDETANIISVLPVITFYFVFIISVFVDTRLWETNHPRKRFQNFRQSCKLSTDRIEIHQSQLASRDVKKV